jgi:hypothetical protein
MCAGALAARRVRIWQPRGSGQFVVYVKCKRTRRAGQRCRNAIAWL